VLDENQPGHEQSITQNPGAPVAIFFSGHGLANFTPWNGMNLQMCDIAQGREQMPLVAAKPTRNYHPSRVRRATAGRARRTYAFEIPTSGSVELNIAGRTVALTNLHKPFWPELGITKGDLLRYYAGVADVLLPHLIDRAMVMKRYPHGAHGEFFFMKRAPTPRPEWIETCSIEHESANIIDFPMIQDLPALLWVINLGCVDLNPWYARCDDVDRPDYLHFDLDPVSPTGGNKAVPFDRVLETALVVRDELARLKIPSYAKTTGSRGIHVYVPIVRGPTQKEVWTFAKALAQRVAAKHPDLITSEYRIAKRPQGRVLVDYNQNAWGRTLASVYSVRPKPQAPVSIPVTWREIERGITIEQFHLRNAAARIKKVGDLWKPLLEKRGRFDLARLSVARS
jgi:bifunctional non-homologous end joining protein LigD